jgi:hypothetical protein
MDDEAEMADARIYRVWRVDCSCGETIDYGEDDVTVPERCEGCGGRLETPSDD